MRIFLKYALAFLAVAGIAVAGHRFLAGRWPSPAVGAALTVALFAAAIVLDAMYGW